MKQIEEMLLTRYTFFCSAVFEELKFRDNEGDVRDWPM